MKTKIHGCALALALTALATLPALSRDGTSAQSASLALPGEEILLGGRVALLAPPHPVLDLRDLDGSIACPPIHPSLAGDLSEALTGIERAVRPGPGHDLDPDEALAFAAGATTPEPGTLLLALAGTGMLLLRRRKLS